MMAIFRLHGRDAGREAGVVVRIHDGFVGVPVAAGAVLDTVVGGVHLDGGWLVVARDLNPDVVHCHKRGGAVVHDAGIGVSETSRQVLCGREVVAVQVGDLSAVERAPVLGEVLDVRRAIGVEQGEGQGVGPRALTHELSGEGDGVGFLHVGGEAARLRGGDEGGWRRLQVREPALEVWCGSEVLPFERNLGRRVPRRVERRHRAQGGRARHVEADKRQRVGEALSAVDGDGDGDCASFVHVGRAAGDLVALDEGGGDRHTAVKLAEQPVAHRRHIRAKNVDRVGVIRREWQQPWRQPRQLGRRLGVVELDVGFTAGVVVNGA
mmetsp:Transcript_4710/g.15417  ORF Transcript_4710/g.15417 Transcript_4710/m.15417 type:complete len:323 (-) Transcript_4710:4508-5476(-)